MTNSKVNRSTQAGRAYLDLQKVANRSGREPGEFFQLYALEGFIARLAQSSYRDQLVIKGGALLAAFGARRPTQDVDLLGTRISNDVGKVLEMCKEISAIPHDDGLEIDYANAKAQTIRDGDLYEGVRVHFHARLATAKLAFHVDVNVGDPVWPTPGRMLVPCLLGSNIEVIGYPLTMVLAEKLSAALEFGDQTTRWRDFGDIYLLTRSQPVSATSMWRSLNAVTEKLNGPILPLEQKLAGFGRIGQPKWTRWRKRLQLEDRLPESFEEVLQAIIDFADPVLASHVHGYGADWNPIECCWEIANAYFEDLVLPRDEGLLFAGSH